MSYHSHRVLLLYFQQLASLSDEPNSDQSQLPLFLHLYQASIFHLFVCHLQRNSSQLGWIHLLILMSPSALCYILNNLFPLATWMIDCGSLMQLMNIYLVFMAFKCHDHCRLVLWRSFPREDLHYFIRVNGKKPIQTNKQTKQIQQLLSLPVSLQPQQVNRLDTGNCCQVI